jgi:magnesium transporter
MQSDDDKNSKNGPKSPHQDGPVDSSQSKDLDQAQSSQIFSDQPHVDPIELIESVEAESLSEIEIIRESWSRLSEDNKKESFEKLNRADSVEFFLTLKSNDQYLLVKELPLGEKRTWVRLLAPDDVADLIQEVPESDHEQKDEYLSLLDPQTRREVTALLAYAEDNAGGIMSSRFIRLRPYMNVDEAISYIRIQAKTQVETIYYAYVLTPDMRLLGVVSFRELFSAPSEKKIEDLMHTDVVKIPVDLDQEQIGQIFSQNELMAIPVIDAEQKMVGIVTFDDVAEVVQEEATEDIHKIGAVETLDAPYLQIKFSEMLKKRAGWLMVLFIGEMFTATALGYFEHILERAVVLSMFLPLIISSGGNSGSQASTLIVRAMALGEVRIKDWWRVLVREISTGLALGLCLGVIGMIRIYFWPWRESMYGAHYGPIALTVGCSVLGVVLWGTISGSMLPFILRFLKLDPAAASAPAVATIVDVTGVIIYFTMAITILKGILL